MERYLIIPVSLSWQAARKATKKAGAYRRCVGAAGRQAGVPACAARPISGLGIHRAGGWWNNRANAWVSQRAHAAHPLARKFKPLHTSAPGGIIAARTRHFRMAAHGVCLVLPACSAVAAHNGAAASLIAQQTLAEEGAPQLACASKLWRFMVLHQFAVLSCHRVCCAWLSPLRA